MDFMVIRDGFILDAVGTAEECNKVADHSRRCYQGRFEVRPVDEVKGTTKKHLKSYMNAITTPRGEGGTRAKKTKVRRV